MISDRVLGRWPQAIATVPQAFQWLGQPAGGSSLTDLSTVNTGPVCLLLVILLSMPYIR